MGQRQTFNPGQIFVAYRAAKHLKQSSADPGYMKKDGAVNTESPSNISPAHPAIRAASRSHSP
jgi:hypothetical protein